MRQSFKRSATTIGRSAKRRRNGDLFTQVHAEASFCSGEPCFGPVRLVFYLAGVRVQRGAGPGQRGTFSFGAGDSAALCIGGRFYHLPGAGVSGQPLRAAGGCPLAAGQGARSAVFHSGKDLWLRTPNKTEKRSKRQQG